MIGNIVEIIISLGKSLFSKEPKRVDEILTGETSRSEETQRKADLEAEEKFGKK